MRKKCNKCSVRKRPTEFHKDGQNPDGLSNRCKDCAKTNAIKKYNEDPAPYKERAKARDKANGRNNRGPEGRLAIRSQVANAVRNGTLVKPDQCSCGNSPVEGHHEDYSKPLDVVWVCKPCHDKIHKLKMRNEK